ncbi:MAG: hypothetical protein ABH834_07145 [Candidatus Altiarchaeota archaeon]
MYSRMRQLALTVVLLLALGCAAQETTTVPATTTFPGTTTILVTTIPSTTTITGTTTVSGTTTVPTTTVFMTTTIPSTTTVPTTTTIYGIGTSTIPSTTTVPSATTTIPQTGSTTLPSSTTMPATTTMPTTTTTTTIILRQGCREMSIEVDRECVGEEMSISVTERSRDDEPVRDAVVIIYRLGRLMAEQTTDKEGITRYTPQMEGEYKIIARKSPKYCSETEDVKIVACESPNASGSGSGISDAETTTSTSVITEAESTTVAWTTSTTTSSSTSSSSTIPETTSTVAASSTTSVTEDADASSPSFIGRFLYNAGKASLLGAIIVVALMTANSMRTRGKPKEKSMWTERPKTKLQSI